MYNKNNNSSITLKINKLFTYIHLCEKKSLNELKKENWVIFCIEQEQQQRHTKNATAGNSVLKSKSTLLS